MREQKQARMHIAMREQLCAGGIAGSIPITNKTVMAICRLAGWASFVLRHQPHPGQPSCSGAGKY